MLSFSDVMPDRRLAVHHRETSRFASGEQGLKTRRRLFSLDESHVNLLIREHRKPFLHRVSRSEECDNCVTSPCDLIGITGQKADSTK